MRIEGYIEHPIMKITVMMMNMKYVVKLEAGLLEQTYKLRESDQIRSLKDIQRLLDDTFLEECLAHFQRMQQNLFTAYDREMGRQKIT